MNAKSPTESRCIKTEIVLPNDTNTLGNLRGGKLLHWIDIAAAIAAHRHCSRVVVTAAVNNVAFDEPIRLGDIVTFEAELSRSFKSSMEVFVDVYVESGSGKKRMTSTAIYTFVAVDQLGSPIEVPEVRPETDIQKERYKGALRRRQLSLILSKKMKPEDATELKALFFPED
ncbi:MAG: hotdog domain-containing protein [Vicingaceae bacterium]